MQQPRTACCEGANLGALMAGVGQQDGLGGEGSALCANDGERALRLVRHEPFVLGRLEQDQHHGSVGRSLQAGAHKNAGGPLEESAVARFVISSQP